MIDEQAEAILAEVFAPLATEKFLGAIGQSWFSVKGSAGHPRSQLFGADPRQTMLGAYGTHAHVLDSHSPAPTDAAPPLRAASSSADFLQIIGGFHERGYTVRIPDVVEPRRPSCSASCARSRSCSGSRSRPRCSGARRARRRSSITTSRTIIIVHLTGRKRWFISSDPPGLQNKWAQAGEAPPNLQNHQVLDVEPGDLIYIPGGTPHTVEFDDGIAASGDRLRADHAAGSDHRGGRFPVRQRA